jgi:hypothetical protein
LKGNSLTIMVLLILTAGGILFAIWGEDYTAIEETPVELTRFAVINPEMIDAIEFQKGGDSYQIRRKGREWFLPNLWDSAADRDEVIRFLDDLKAVSGAEKRGESAASHKTFEVDAEQGIRITLKDMDMAPFIDVVVGKADGTGRSFIRMADQDRVFSVKPNLKRRPALGGDNFSAQQWFHKILFQLPGDVEARELILTRGDERIVLEWVPGAPAETVTGESGELIQSGTDPEWWIREPENLQADTNTVKGLLSAMKNVRCEAPLDPTDPAAAGLEEPTASIEVVLVDDSRIILDFGTVQPLPLGGEGISARLRGDDRIVVCSDWVRDGLIKGLDELKVVEPSKPEPIPVPTPIPAEEG